MTDPADRAAARRTSLDQLVEQWRATANNPHNPIQILHGAFVLNQCADDLEEALRSLQERADSK